MSRDALVVGINRYRDEGLADLSSPAADAEAIAQMLEKYGGFKVRRIPEAIDPNTGLPYVGKTTAVAFRQLEEALVQLFAPDSRHVPDTALFYFSGHGIRKQRGVSEGFLAASDVYPQMGFCGLPLQWLRKLLEASSVRQQVVWLDCCHSGAWLDAGEADPGERGRGRDRAFIAAARDFEAAEQEITSPYSVMTRALLAGLEPQPDRPVTNITLVDFLNRELQNATQRPIYTNFGEPIELIRPLATPEKTAAPTEVTATDICPYKGLAYFECNDEDPKYFYGRGTLTDELLDGVRRGNFLAVLGASGSGKSSVLRAGLMHQLKLGRQVSGSETWQVRVLVPGSHPLENLAAAFLDGDVSDLERSQQLAIAEQRIGEGAAGLRRLVQSATASRVVLVIDQFEEVFTLCSDRAEREQFFQCLLGGIPPNPPSQGGLPDLASPLSRGGSPVLRSPQVEELPWTGGGSDKLCIVLAMRADFFSKCLEREYSGLADRIRQHLVAVTPMTREELEGAIVRPAKDVGLAIEPELVRQMLADVVGAPGHLPLLQYALRELWQLRSRSPLTPLEKGGTASSPLLRGTEGDLLTLKTYTQLGGVMGTLNDRATAVYEGLSAAEREVAKHIFLALTQLGEGTEDTRRPVRQLELVTSRHPDEMVEAVVQKLADERLIVTREMTDRSISSNPPSQKKNITAPLPKGGWGDRTQKRDSAAIVDVAHEALIRHWQKLRQWLDESRETLRQTRKIEQAAAEWEERGKGKDDLLQGRRLREVRELREDVALSKLAEEFIDRSVRQRRIDLLKIAGVVAIPILFVVGIVEPSLRQERIDRDLAVLRSGKGTAKEIGYLTKGCNVAVRDILPAPLANVLFGNCVSLAGYELEKIYLVGANLWEADLRGADLGEANLRGANLRGANLWEADLREADLQGAWLLGAWLLGAKLWGADLQEANLRGANFWEADLQGAKLRGADLRGADLRVADLRGADLRGAKLWEADLRGADLWEADLRGADLWGAKLQGADLQGADLGEAKLAGQVKNLTRAQVKSACNWKDAKFDPDFQAKLNQSPDPETEVDCSRWE